MLEEKLQPILTILRADERDFEREYEIIKNWFQEHKENLADNLSDLTFLCELPNEDRYLLTYPVIGNWVLEQMKAFEPQTEHQKKVYELMKKVVAETRFNNHHMKNIYDDPIAFTRMKDELCTTMLSNPEESMPIHKFMREIEERVDSLIVDETLPIKETYTTDLGHGLLSPVSGLTYYVARPFERLVKNNRAGSIGLTIMVVDDENPEEWYNRLLSAGFEEIKGQQGIFYDCETALEALERGRYDVILTDLELGEGKMDGITFVEKAYEVQIKKGIKPAISVFSFNKEKLSEADDRLRKSKGEQKVFHQVDYNYKSRWTATGFKEAVINALR
ncbi:MAG: response regulator [archaeon]